MFGLILVLLYVAYQYIVNSLAIEQVFLPATNFLFWWYLLWSIPLGILVLLIAGVLTTVLGFGGHGSIGGWLGGLLGVASGGVVSLFIIVVFLFRRALYVGGAYLLNASLTPSGIGYEWDGTKLIFGGVLLFVALLTRPSSSSSSSSSSN